MPTMRSLLVLCSRLIHRRTMSSLSVMESASALSPLVYRVLGANPGAFTLQGTNTYIVGNGPNRILVDTGEPNVPAFTDRLATVLRQLGDGVGISAIVCTHWHMDHVGGVNDVIGKVIGHAVPVHKLQRHDAPEQGAPTDGYSFVHDGHIFQTSGATLRAMHLPGHTEDHMVLLLEEENAVFSGDCVLGEGTAVFEDLFTYMQSLAKLLDLKPSKIYPGHGPVIDDPVERVQQYIDHRNQREKQILEMLTNTAGSVSPMDIVNSVYSGISPAVKLGAVNNVKHHLSKLLKEGRVLQIDGGDRWQIVPFKEGRL